MSYEHVYGKVMLPAAVAAGSHYDVHGRLIPTTGGRALVLHDTDGTVVVPAVATLAGSDGTAYTATAAIPPLRSYAEWYSSGGDAADDDHSSSSGGGGGGGGAPRCVSARVTAEQFKQLSLKGGRRAEADLWSLVEDVLLDAGRAPAYDLSVIGIAATPPQRRWFVSHYAHIQDLLMRNPTLRRACIVTSWLEKTYRTSNINSSSGGINGGGGGGGRQPRLRGEEDVVLRQILLTHLRGGETQRAIDAAITCEDASYSCLLSAAQLQTVREPWFLQTAVVPLFGEYAHGELDQAWCGNEHRLHNLAQLYEDSLHYNTVSTNNVRGGGGGGSDGKPLSSSSSPSPPPPLHHGFDAVIGAALCGNLTVLEPAFTVSGNWRDIAWCFLRCALTVAFTKTLVDAGVALEGGPYRTFIERQTGSEDAWLPLLERQMVAGLTSRLTGRFLAAAPIEEQLQMRFILQVLSPDDGGGGGVVSWLDVDLPPPTAHGPEWGADAHKYREAVRVFTHLLLVMDAAYAETLSHHSIQGYCGEALGSALTKYSSFMAVLPRYPFDQGLVAMIGMAARLRDHRHRAAVYAAFLQSAREYELSRQSLSRERLEEQEAQLVRLFVERDGDVAVHAEVQRLLNHQVPLEELLTHSKLAESILWGAMHAVSLHDYLAVMRQGLEACAEFWVMEPQAELDAIADVSRIIMRRVIPYITSSSSAAEAEQHSLSVNDADNDNTARFYSSSSPERRSGGGGVAGSSATQPLMTPMELSEATFWYLFSECRVGARTHTKIAGQLSAARATSSSSESYTDAHRGGGGGMSGPTTTTSVDRTLLFQLAQDEAAEMRRLTDCTQRAVRHGGAAVHRARASVTAIVWLAQQLAEDVTLSLLSGPTSGEREGLALMQCVFALVAELDEGGYLSPGLPLPRACAADLYSRVRAMRVTYGQQAHRRQVMAALQLAAATGGGGGSGGGGDDGSRAIEA